ncbi:DEAD/DEAH box helicase [Aeromonas caviae]
MNIRQLHYAPLLKQLHQRAVRSVISQLALRSKTLSSYLENQYFQSPGANGSLMADPVFESTFGWEAADEPMDALRDKLISSQLVNAVNVPVPFAHQLRSWRVILEQRKSLLVSSGTGSGKTECFMVPVLEDLIRQTKVKRQTLVGTQAIFLYPLNALINSQQERLRAWTKGYKGKIRFALYNGETKQTRYEVAEEQEKYPEQLLSREAIYDTPPSIMVTNTTMLEYMLIRHKDAPITDKSQGMLKYIVLDEAHSYVGSQAAELALLLRRVMQAFNVGPATGHPVQIIATSATIGEDSKEGNIELARFVAELAGVGECDVEVVRGYRQIPTLPAVEALTSHPESLAELDALSPVELYHRLGGYRVTRALRKALSDGANQACKLSELLAEARPYWPSISAGTLLLVLDLMAKSRSEEGDNSVAFTPLRMHGFIRTLSGLWACSNAQCRCKETSLQGTDWPFGQVYFDVRMQCDCGAQVFEVLRCSGCGTAYLSAKEEIKSDNSVWLSPQPAKEDEDEFALENDVVADEEESASEGHSSVLDRLLGAQGDLTLVSLEKGSEGRIDPLTSEHYIVQMVTPKARGEGKPRVFSCSCCGDTQQQNDPLFRSLRLGAPFFLSDMIPTLLEFSPLPQNPEEQRGPFNGRRLLTFTDSRQGTARISARLQQDADRAALRTLCYHELANIVSQQQGIATAQRTLLDQFITQISVLPMFAPQVEILRQAMNGETLSPEAFQIVDPVRRMISASSDAHAQAVDTLFAASGSQQIKPVSWKVLAEQLAGSVDLADRMRAVFKDLSGLDLTKLEFADFCLYSEFGRRPKNSWTLESLGLVSIHYPFIDEVTRCPADWQLLVTDRTKQLPEWRNLLKITLDFFVRERSAVFYENESYPRWMGSRFPVKMLQGPDKKQKSLHRELLWPRIHDRYFNRVIKLLIAAFPSIQPEQGYWRDIVNNLMKEVWDVLRPKFRQFESGYQFDIKQQAYFYSPKTVWRCPYTRRALDVTLMGYSPYLPGSDGIAPELAHPVEMPSLPLRHWRLPGGAEMARDERLNWLETEAQVKQAREEGLWSTRSDRLALKDGWYRLEEHSAQRTPEQNQFNEKQFKAGKVNVLNCSTTMEMGVDIGGMSLVAMNNVPPAPANYLQRAGRAGRRGETASAAITLCKNTAHGMEVFKNPLWPFQMRAKAPQVRLESASIVQRHVNALLLGRFLRAEVPDATKLSCKWFFEEEGSSSQCQRFLHWLSHSHADMADGLTRLVKGTALVALSVDQLLEHTRLKMQTVDNAWRAQLATLLQNAAALKADSSDWEATPAGKAITYQLRDYRSAYLFSKLMSETFLPGHGFPVGVVNFNYLTMEELEKRKALKASQSDLKEGKENFSRNMEKLPSRDLPTALREYAPGADVVLGGKVYRSAGIMLGKVLASGKELSGDHHIPWFWHCGHCGAGATSATYPAGCSHCGASSAHLRIVRYLQPIGFATDIRYKPHNDVSSPAQLPYQDPRVLVPSAAWVALPDATLGRYRFSNSGELFHFSSGEHGQGYAICLSCGRTESQVEAGRTPEALADPKRENSHLLLRGGSTDQANKTCRGHVSKNLWLGYSSRTDMVELQLNDENGLLIRNEVAARSLAVALREGLAHALGIENTELGVTTQQTMDANNASGFSIFIYDNNAGGAGYAVQLIDLWGKVFNYAAKLLNCDCDKCCHHCLLGYDSQHYVNKLDRLSALPWVTPARIQRFQLAEAFHHFGLHSRIETFPLMSRLAQRLSTGLFHTCTLMLGGDAGSWDFTNWPLLNDLMHFASVGGKVELLLTVPCHQLPDRIRHQLAALAAMPGERISVLALPAVPRTLQQGYWLAQLTGQQTMQWASSEIGGCVPGEQWGISQQTPVVTTSEAAPACHQGNKLAAADLLPVLPAGAVRINLAEQLDGPLGEFGSRFWALITSHSPLWNQRFSQKSRIKRVQYSDRYLHSPLTTRLLGELLTELVDQGMADQAALQVNVKKLGFNAPQHEAIYNSWQTENDRKEAITLLLEEGYLGPSWQGNIEVNISDKAATGHGRELVVTFEDGSERYLLLDMGLGYWRSQGSAPFDFAAPVQRQVELIAGSTAQLIAPASGLHSYIIAG